MVAKLVVPPSTHGNPNHEFEYSLYSNPNLNFKLVIVRCIITLYIVLGYNTMSYFYTTPTAYPCTPQVYARLTLAVKYIFIWIL